MSIPVVLLIFFISLDSLAVLLFVLLKHQQKSRYRKEMRVRELLLQAAFSKGPIPPSSMTELHRYYCVAIRELSALFGIMIPGNAEKERLCMLFEEAGIMERLKKMLSSRTARRRYMSALTLRYLLPESQRECMAERLKNEQARHVKIALVKGLLDTSCGSCLNALAESLGTDPEYDKTVAAMISASGPRFIGWARQNLQNPDIRYRLMILYGAPFHTVSWLRDYAEISLKDDNRNIREAALACIQTYPDIAAQREDNASPDPDVLRATVLSRARQGGNLDIISFADNFTRTETFEAAVEGLRDYVHRFPDAIDAVLDLIHKTESEAVRRGSSLCLAGRVPYLLAGGIPLERVSPVIRISAEEGFSSGLIAFINSSRDRSLFLSMKPLLLSLVEEIPGFRSEIIRFLKPQLQTELEIEHSSESRNVPRIPLNRKDRLLILMLLVLVIAIPIAAMFGTFVSSGGGLSFSAFARHAVHSYTAVFAWYAAALNTIYVLLLISAIINLYRQTRYWNIQDKDFLFTPGVVPSIAVIAPAYNEEKTVAESVNSLLTLIYPDYQVIVVNDGSADNTIGVLKDEFQLIRIDRQSEGNLSTAPVRGIYQSPLNSRLLVIDKENGGKADALNCGINYGKKEFICSIDSDSLLEPDSLLRMTSEAMTSRHETIAIGGNILPVNGCSVSHGALQKIALGKNRYARLQTIEYLRSFIAGRLGWAQMNALLIISGAFGLFKRARVLEIGGYLTGRGIHKKDTVGEDMELVVRLIHHMGEVRKPYRVQYAATANCWTEVPEDLNSICKQRDRWHRGLVEIMTFHLRMLFNPRYGTAGLIGLPYFLIFEIIGPFYEFSGYLFLFIGFIAGLHSLSVYLILFSVCILFGTLVSLISLILSEHGIVYFRHREIVKLLLSTFSENFGYRQLMGWLRVFSLTGMLFKNKGWQKLERKGFSSAPARSKQ